MTSRPRVRRSRASSSASVVLPAAGGPSTATRSGCEVVADSIAAASRSRRSPRVPSSMVCDLTVSWFRVELTSYPSRRGPGCGRLSLRRHHAETLIVPMSLIRDAYRAEILDGLADAGEEVLHVFLEADAGALRERLNARVTHPDKDWDRAAREFGMTGVDEIVAAAARQPARTLMLRSDKLTPAKLADEVLARANLHRD